MFKTILGKEGEKIAEKILVQEGYKIIHRNYRCSIGEIDLIARHGAHLVFIEVKTRSSWTYGHPAEAVNYKKQRKIVQVSLQYIKEKNIAQPQCRYDVMSIVVLGGETMVQYQLVKGAFWGSHGYYL